MRNATFKSQPKSAPPCGDNVLRYGIFVIGIVFEEQHCNIS